MDRRFKLSLLGAAVFAAAPFTGAALSSALAADLLPPPPVVEAPEVVQKSNRGWYLRGDISYDFQEHKGYYNENNQRFYAPHRMDDAFNVGLGIGYQVSNHLRVDLTGEYVFASHTGFQTTGFCGVDLLGNGFGVCSSKDETEVDKFKLMANAYIDLGHVGKFTPYVGAGIGGAYVSYDGLTTTQTCTTTAPNSCPAPHPAGTTTSTVNTQGQFAGSSNWRFAWALHAGTAYSLSDSLKLDIGYTYSRIEGGRAFDYTQNSATDLTSNIYDEGFEDHTIRAGLRYAFH